MRRLILFSLAMLLACGGSNTVAPVPPPPPPPPPPPAPVAAVTVTLGSSSLIVGGTTAADAVVKDAAGNVLLGRTVTWSSTSPTIASVSSSGLVSALAEGTTSVIATSEGQSGSASLMVLPIPAATVAVSLTASSIQTDGTTTASAVVKDGAGNVLPGRTVVWSSSIPAVATVSQTGVVSGVSAGQTTITGTSGGAVGQATLTVIDIPVVLVAVAMPSNPVVEGTVQFATATAFDALGHPLTNRPVLWSVNDPTFASVSQAGAVTAIAPGIAVIRATVSGVSGIFNLTIVRTPVADVIITPSPVGPLRTGDHVQLTATPRDASGNPLIGRPVTWSSNDPTHLTVSTTGLVTAVSGGALLTPRISATADGVSGAISIAVFGWAVLVTPDPGGGFPTTNAILASEPDGIGGSQGGGGSTLAVACLGGGSKTLSLFVVTNHVTGSGTVAYQFDNEAVVPAGWTEGSDFLSEFFSGTPAATIAFIDKLGISQTFTFSYDAFSHGMLTAKFITRGGGNAMARVLAACQ